MTRPFFFSPEFHWLPASSELHFLNGLLCSKKWKINTRLKNLSASLQRVVCIAEKFTVFRLSLSEHIFTRELWAWSSHFSLCDVTLSVCLLYFRHSYLTVNTECWFQGVVREQLRACIYNALTVNQLLIHCIRCWCLWNTRVASSAVLNRPTGLLAANLHQTGPRPPANSRSRQPNSEAASSMAKSLVPCNSGGIPWVWGSQLMPVYESRAVLQHKESRREECQQFQTLACVGMTSNRLCQHICRTEQDDVHQVNTRLWWF